MIDSEVARLRRLRGSALRVRAVARALGNTRQTLQDPLLNHARCAAWRVARVASGRLRMHPYARFQEDPGLGVVFKNSFVAATAGLRARRSRRQALLSLEGHLTRLARQLDDARALTLAPDLSDSLGRLQIEIRSVLTALERRTALEQRTAPEQRTALERETPVGLTSVVAGPSYAAPADADWPYLAF